jgi:hypothetical protein
MNKFKLIKLLLLCFLISTETYSAESKFRTDMTDLNTDIIVSLEAYPEPEQFLNRDMGNKLLSPIRYPNFDVKPIDVVQGTILRKLCKTQPTAETC